VGCHNPGTLQEVPKQGVQSCSGCVCTACPELGANLLFVCLFLKSCSGELKCLGCCRQVVACLVLVVCGQQPRTGHCWKFCRQTPDGVALHKRSALGASDGQAVVLKGRGNMGSAGVVSLQWQVCTSEAVLLLRLAERVAALRQAVEAPARRLCL